MADMKTQPGFAVSDRATAAAIEITDGAGTRGIGAGGVMTARPAGWPRTPERKIKTKGWNGPL